MNLKNLIPLSYLAAGSLQAAMLVTPTGLTNTTVTPPNNNTEFFSSTNLVNNSGLSGPADIGNYTTITHGSAGGTTAWTTDAPNGGSGDYHGGANPGADPRFTLTLDQSYSLTNFVYWGYHFGAANGNEAREFFLEFSTDGGSTFPASTTVSQPLDSHAFSSAVTLPLGGAFSANTVRVTLTDNHFGGGAAGGDRSGLGELKLIGDAIPEPTGALLAGLGSLMLLRRRR